MGRAGGDSRSGDGVLPGVGAPVGSASPYADGEPGGEGAAGGGRTGEGAPGGGSGSPSTGGGRGEDRAGGVGRSGDGAPGEGDTHGGAARAVDSGNPYNDTVRITERAVGSGRAGGGGASYADTVRIGARGAGAADGVGAAGGSARDEGPVTGPDAARPSAGGDPQRSATPDGNRAGGVGGSGDRAPGEGDTPAGPPRAVDGGNPYADAVSSVGRAGGSGGPDPARHADPAGGGPHARGLRLRREVLGAGDALARHLDPGDFSADYEDLVTRVAWGDVWSRPGLDRRTRFLLTLTALTVGGHLDELATHTRAALRGGVSPDEIKETLLHASLYCGLPAVGRAFEVARRVVAEETDA
ncbi:carboxymuconolactone decarboxylase family protein [Streptomyces abikoensis]|uniref:carboxymuconolactone decarboxylase family protein n=1 Tax=Streptomyces abikoensis TaxID=97398 RepID=UPI0027E4F068|nr:carboxymuconolactone decarboxylase family protein [Streptomyces abikoensis]